MLELCRPRAARCRCGRDSTRSARNARESVPRMCSNSKLKSLTRLRLSILRLLAPSAAVATHTSTNDDVNQRACPQPTPQRADSAACPAKARVRHNGGASGRDAEEEARGESLRRLCGAEGLLQVLLRAAATNGTAASEAGDPRKLAGGRRYRQNRYSSAEVPAARARARAARCSSLSAR